MVYCGHSKIAMSLSFCLGVTLASLLYSHILTQPILTAGNSPFRRVYDRRLDIQTEGTTESLKHDVRVLCWVMTSPSNLDKRALHVKNTWGRRCSKLLFMSSKTNDTFPAIGLNVSEGREHLTAKTMEAFKYCHDFHLDDADWFMKADDDTYVILENLRHFLSDKDPDEPIAYGQHFAPNLSGNKKGYLSGGAGYVFSKQGLKMLVKFGQNNSSCRQDGGFEDLEIGICMKNINISIGNTTDPEGRRTFHSFQPETFIHGKFHPMYKTYDAKSKDAKGIEFLSDFAISFHYIKPGQMYDLEYFVYHLKPYGVVSKETDINVPI